MTKLLLLLVFYIVVGSVLYFLYKRDIRKSDIEHQKKLKKISENHAKEMEKLERMYPRWSTDQFVFCTIVENGITENDCLCVVRNINFHIENEEYSLHLPLPLTENKTFSFIELFDIKNNRKIYLRRYRDGENVSENEQHIILSRIYDFYEFVDEDHRFKRGHCIVTKVICDDDT